MLNTAAKIYFTLAALALVAAVAYAMSVGDRAGWVLMWFVVATAGISGVAVAASGISDRARRVAPDAPIEEVPVSVSVVPSPSNVPLLVALAVGILAVGLVVGAVMVVVGIIACLIAGGAWLGLAWREDARWDPAKGTRLSDRYVAPLGFPIIAFLIFLLLIVAVSRVLLAVNEHVSVVVAIGVGVIILLLFSLLASRASLSRSVISGIVGVSAIVLVSAGVAGAAKGEREFEEKGAAEPQAVELVARNLAFNTDHLDVTAGKPFVLTLHNEDADVYHNVGVYTANPGGSPVVAGPPVVGIDEIEYDWTVPNPGSYTFRCDFHANMVGTIVANP